MKNAFQLTQEFFQIVNDIATEDFVKDNPDLMLPVFSNNSNHSSQIVSDESRVNYINATYLYSKRDEVGEIMGMFTEHEYERPRDSRLVHFKINERVQKMVAKAYKTCKGNGSWQMHLIDEKLVIPIYRKVLKEFQPEGKVILSACKLGSYSRGYRESGDYFGWVQLLSTTLERIKIRPRVEELSINVK